jgi:V8-like Glu-specific endopeptidase
MSTLTRHASALLVSFALIGPLATAKAPLPQDEILPREEVAKRAKPATALVEVKPGSGSGFCVHASGLFVTNEHVVRSVASGGTVVVVLNPGLKTQQVLKAKVIRRDKKLDLALLKVEGEDKKFEALKLGSDSQLGELTEVIAFGFPFGQRLAQPGEYPAISVNVGSVTSLRHDGQGELHRIQLDAVLNPGNSGGPVLNRSGKVVGVVVSGIQGAGINMAIPVSHLERFLARPDVVFTTPAVKSANQHEACLFEAKTIQVVAPSGPLEMELVLGAGPGKERRFPMKLVDGTYQVKAIPVPAPEGPPVFRVGVHYEDGSVSGTVEDRAFRVGEKTVKLSQVHSLRLGPKPQVILGNKEKLDGNLADLETLAVKVGKQSLRLDLSAAVEIKVETPEDTTGISCTVVARHSGKEVGRHSAPLYVEGIGRPTLESLAEGKFVKPPRAGAPVSSLRVVSSKGDYIGQGQSYSYEGEELVARPTNRGVTLNVDGWMVNFGGPGNRFLEVGEYVNAKRHPFSGDAPGLEFFGKGRGANQLSGKFVVWELEVKGNEVVRLAIDFIQQCEGTQPPLYGSLRINSSFH